jgi:hypothetical protein
MIVVCNGSYKTGSTWVFSQLLELFEQHEDFGGFPVDHNQGRNFRIPKNDARLDISYAARKNLVAKTHTYNKETLDFYKDSGFFLLYTKRKKEDVIESHYFHYISKISITIPFPVYIFTVGLLKCIESNVYDRVIENGHYYNCCISFSDLQANPKSVLESIISSLDLDFTEQQVEKAASSSNLRGDKYSNFFGQADRDWFFVRPRKKTGTINKLLLRFVVSISERLIKNDIVFRIMKFNFVSFRKRQDPYF